MKTDQFLQHKIVPIAVTLLIALVGPPTRDRVFATSQRSASSQQGEQPVEEPLVIPMELLANRPMVRVKVNGQGPFALLVVPEAQATLIDQTLAAELDPKQLRYRNTSSQLDIEMEIGTSKPKLSVGSTDAAKLLPALETSTPPRGIISASLWPSRLVTLDYPRYQITVEPGALPEPNQQDVFSLKRESPDTTIHVAAADRTVPCQFDPMFAGGLLLPQSFITSFPLVGRLGEARLMVTPKGRAFVREAQIAGDVKLGMFELAKPLVQFADSADACIIGGHWLRGFAITYDLANGRVRIARQRAGRPVEEEGGHKL